jgi:hypothetical protein
MDQEKVFQAILTFEKIKMNPIKHRLGYRKMSSNDVLSEIIAMTISDKNVEDALAHARALKKNSTIKNWDVITLSPLK